MSQTSESEIAMQSAPQPRSGPVIWIALVISLLLALGAGFVGSMASTPNLEPWYSSLNKPWFNPPNWVFGPVWTALFIAMAVAAWMIWRAPVEDRIKRTPLLVYVVHLIVNVGWSYAFFGMQSPGLGLVVIAVLWAMVIWLALRFGRIRPLAGLLFVPYVLWVSFAGVLNIAFWHLN